MKPPQNGIFRRSTRFDFHPGAFSADQPRAHNPTAVFRAGLVGLEIKLGSACEEVKRSTRGTVRARRCVEAELVPGVLETANQAMPGTGIGSPASPPNSLTRTAPALMSSRSK
jgi:hypothetical protein